MKLAKTLSLVFASVIVALVAGAVTPTPKPRASATAAPKPPPEVLPSPMEQLHVAATPVIQSNQTPPKPILYLLRTEPFSANGKTWIRYRYDVFNKSEYPADMFAAAPSLPPCGLNTNASR